MQTKLYLKSFYSVWQFWFFHFIKLACYQWVAGGFVYREWGLLVRLLRRGHLSSATALFITVFPTVVQNLDVTQWLRNACIEMEGNLTNRGKNEPLHKEIQWERVFPLFLPKLLVVCPSPPVDFEWCCGAKGVKVTDIKESFVPFSQSHRSLLATDLEHDTAISWCHTWVISSCFWNCGLEKAALGYFLT